MQNPEFTFHVLIENVEGTYVAHCLEMGLVATSDDTSELSGVMVKLITRQLEFALKNNNPSDIYHSAPQAVWEKLRAAVEEEKTLKRVNVDNWPVTLNQVSYAAAC